MADLATMAPPAVAAAPTDTAKTTTDPKQTTSTPAAKAVETGAKPPADGKVESAKKEAAPADPTKPFLVKVDGKEYHLSQEEVTKLAEKGMGADKRFEEAAKARSEAAKIKAMSAEFFRLLKANPEAILTSSKLGLPFRKIAEEFLAKEYQKEMMDPKERELVDAKAKLAEAEEEKATEKLRREQEQFERLRKHHSETFEKEVIAALEVSGLPKTRWTVRQVGYHLLQGLKKGVKLSAGDVMDVVKEDWSKHLAETFSTLDGEKLMEIMGEENVKKLNEALLRKVRGGDNPAPVTTTTTTTDGSGRKLLTKEEFRARTDERARS
jgi:hypothetical protein